MAASIQGRIWRSPGQCCESFTPYVRYVCILQCLVWVVLLISSAIDSFILLIHPKFPHPIVRSRQRLYIYYEGHGNNWMMRFVRYIHPISLVFNGVHHYSLCTKIMVCGITVNQKVSTTVWEENVCLLRFSLSPNERDLPKWYQTVYFIYSSMVLW